jgi:hypothetical protein
MIARLSYIFKTNALIAHSADQLVDLPVLVCSFDSVNLDMARHAIDVTAYDPVGSSSSTDARRALSMPDVGPVIGEARNRTRFAAKVAQAQPFKRGWISDFCATRSASMSMERRGRLRFMFLNG